MLLLRKRIFSSFLSASPPPVPLSAFHRLLSTTSTATTASAPFSIEDYLVATCGLTPHQASKASKKLSHLKSPSRPDAVLAFVADLGLSRSGIAAAVAADPRLLCADVQRTLARRVAVLADLGISRPQIACLLTLAHGHFRTSCLGSNVAFWLQVFGSWDKLLLAVEKNCKLLGSSLEKVAIPNLALLQQCGIGACDIARLSLYSCRLLTMNHKVLQCAVARVDELGMERGSRMFRRALDKVAFMSKENVADKLQLLEKLGWSQEDALVAVRKAPNVLGLSAERIQRTVEFLMGDVGLDPPYITHRPVLLMYSLEKRLLPRHCLIKVLKAEGLLNVDFDYYFTASLSEKKFLHKFVDPYKDCVPGLADDYASRCSGKAPEELLDENTGIADANC